MKKIAIILYALCFFALIFAPFLCMPWAKNQLTENRPLAQWPTLFVEGSVNLTWPKEMEDYFRDRFAGRLMMVDAWGRVLATVFNVSANDKVILGDDGWLFFQETEADYDGSAALGAYEMEDLINYLRTEKNAAEARGQAFIIVIAPNKNSIYGEYMPDRYYRSTQAGNLERLLLAEGLDCIDLVALFSGTERLYYRTDSHWNSTGARLAAQAIMRHIEEKTGVAAALDAVVAGERYIAGDLARMLYPLSAAAEADTYYVAGAQNFRTIGRFRDFNDLNITTESDGAPLRLAMYRDSFADALIPYLSNAYGHVHYNRQTPPDLDSEAFLAADVIIFQMAERRLPELVE